jgi:hypothetical protein
MLERFKRKPTDLDKLIERVEAEMMTFGPDSEDYEKHLAYLERLRKLKAGNSKKPISSDTIALVLGNLAGILIIVMYEQKHVMTSKGLGFIPKTKI